MMDNHINNSTKNNDHLHPKAKFVRLFVMDVDGVLSDGQLIYNAQGIESKAFYVQDGVGLKLLKQAGIQLAIITGRRSAMVEQRATELGINHIIQGRDDKFVALGELAELLGLSLDECAYMGDDLPDLKAIKQAGFGISVPNGCPKVRQVADFVTTKQGGYGAVREACEVILNAQGVYDELLAQFE